MDGPLGFAPSFVSLGREIYDSRGVKEVLFSRGTYQAEVLERGKKSEYPFLQISDEGELSDFFCSCKISEASRGCPHLAAAYFRIFHGSKEPLHVRFQNSFWAALFQIAAKRNGYERGCLKKGKDGRYTCSSQTRKKLFSLKPSQESAKNKIDEILSQKEETESTSIKFSNLLPDELARYKAGTPSDAFRFELSFWSDIAKWIFELVEDQKPYTIAFEGESLPTGVSISFESLELWFYLAEANWPLLVVPLSTVKAPLKVFEEPGRGAAHFVYDEKKKELKLERPSSMNPLKQEKEGLVVGPWIFLAGQGFYKRELHPLFQKEKILENEMSQVLTEWGDELGKQIPLESAPQKGQYRLYFDAASALHIELYLFEPGDLTQPDAACFLPWVYLPCKGFYRIKEWLFEGVEKTIPKPDVAEFVNRHRVWLHQFQGYRTHLGSLESHLIYSFDEEDQLIFKAEVNFPQNEAEMLNFDDWVYVKGEGFYMKKEGRGRLPIHPGLSVPKQEIPLFLKSHRDVLETVQNFFCTETLIERIGLSLKINEGGLIEVAPEVQYAAGVEASQVKIFGDYLYMPGKGFSEIPPISRLPERYREKVEISASQEATFLAYEFDPLKPYILFLDPRLMKPIHLKLKIGKIAKDPRKKGRQWLVQLTYHSEIGVLDPFFVWGAMQARKKYLFSPAGLISFKEPRFQWVRQLTKRRFDRARSLVRLTTLEWIRLSILEQIDLPSGNSPDAVLSRQLLEELQHLEAHRLLDVTRLKSTLRPYQEEGLKWLWFLYCHGLSGLLCDDMGLGKTHQAMALLAAVGHEDPDKRNKYLVVCPTSVIYHWQELLRRFLPELRVSTYYGLERSLDHFNEEYDLLLTSYGILRTGREDLQGIFFEVAIFDEIQVAKNHASQTHHALRAIRAQMRLGLTGTPIENRIRELKALLDLALPGYLPQDALFREVFIQPIEKHQDMEKKSLLGRLVKPFLLRRKKSEVLLDLPEKIEEIAYCDLSEEQKKLYQEIAVRLRDTLYQDLRDPEKPIPYIHVFSALSSLKRICDHPALVLDDVKNAVNHTSGKWDLFVELLNEAHESGQKVVVFSQYLEMLGIIEKHLKKKGIGFASIKGSTRDRNEQLIRFRQDPECTVFVASLLAAGIGIDLTVASIVIHYDRWWNPAKENQATDRVHRIGQNRGVQVFKLVTKNTIEEHIHEMIERKKGLLEDIIGTEDQIQYLTREELVQVFEQMFRNI